MQREPVGKVAQEALWAKHRNMSQVGGKRKKALQGATINLTICGSGKFTCNQGLVVRSGRRYSSKKIWAAYVGPGLRNGDFVLYPVNSGCLCF